MERLDGIASIERVDLTCYELDEKVLPLLEYTLAYISGQVHFELVYEIRRENYITSQELAFKGMGKPLHVDMSIGIISSIISSGIRSKQGKPFFSSQLYPAKAA